jgi:hypothetical protein
MKWFSRAASALVVSALVVSGTVVGLSAPSEATRSLPGLPTSLEALTPPSLPTVGAVGTPLELTLPTWSAGGLVTNTVAWFNSAGPIAGATGTSYTPTAGDAGGVVMAVVTGHLLNLVPVPVPTNAVPIAATDPGSPGDPTDPGDPGDPGDELLTLLSGLRLPATAEVGQLITLTDPVWSLPGVTTTHQWLRDGVPIPGADNPFYVPGFEDAGHDVSARVTGALLGIPGSTVITAALRIPLVTGTQVSPSGDVTVAGAKKIGTLLSLTGPTWDPADATSNYQWLRDEAPIAAATQATYRLAPPDLGHAISVKVTGHRDGFVDNTITSDPVTPVLGDAIQFLTKPRVSGTPRVVKLLTADPGVWGGGTDDGAAPVFGYQWQRDGMAIAGAVAQTYQVQRADAGRRLTVKVTATRPAYQAGTFTTAAVTVTRLASTVRATLAKKVVGRGQRATLAVLVKTAGVVSPTGVVTVMDGTRVLRKVTVAKGRKGKVALSISGLRPGIHRLRADYAGTATIAAASSRVVRLTVRR